jgi:hypothetical protein
MSQATPTNLAAKVESLGEADLLPFHELLDAEMVNEALKAEKVRFNHCIYFPIVTLCLFLSQVIDPDHSCRASVARLIAWRVFQGLPPCNEDTGTYCDARKRLPTAVVRRLVHETARRGEAEAPDSWLWKGRRVYLVDGTTVSMPDTPANQAAFPQPRAQERGLGFPIARLAVLIALWTGLARDLAMGPYKGKETGETALFRKMLDALKRGDVVVGDRCFGSYFMLAELSRRGVDGAFRMHQKRKCDFRRGRILGRSDHVVEWTKPVRPDWMIEAEYSLYPGMMRVRELRYNISVPGYRVGALTVTTTLLDAEAYPASEMATLYGGRWHIETDLRSIKCDMKMDVLRCKAPEMVEKEVWVHLLGYNLIRRTMSQAAAEAGLAPRDVSFKGALQTMTAFQDALRWTEKEERPRLWAALLTAIGGHRVGDRPGRVEPRAIKRRPKPHKILTVPRREARKRLLEAV